jgi:hypothetical protein
VRYQPGGLWFSFLVPRLTPSPFVALVALSPLSPTVLSQPQREPSRSPRLPAPPSLRTCLSFFVSHFSKRPRVLKPQRCFRCGVLWFGGESIRFHHFRRLPILHRRTSLPAPGRSHSPCRPHHLCLNVATATVTTIQLRSFAKCLLPLLVL